jgi:hypothetical protein
VVHRYVILRSPLPVPAITNRMRDTKAPALKVSIQIGIRPTFAMKAHFPPGGHDIQMIAL